MYGKLFQLYFIFLKKEKSQSNESTLPPLSDFFRAGLESQLAADCKTHPGPGARCIKLTINCKLDFNGNFHRILDADWLWCLVAMVVTIESKVTINGNFYATGP